MSAANSTLTQEKLKELFVYDENTGIFTRATTRGRCNRWKEGQVVGHLAAIGYVQIYIDGKLYQAHRLAWLYMYGAMPNGHIDHANAVRSDNRISNLRECDDKLNMQNIRKAHKDSASGLLGVRKLRYGRFLARIYSNKKEISLGVFDDPMDAHQAYLNAKRELHAFCTI